MMQKKAFERFLPFLAVGLWLGLAPVIHADVEVSGLFSDNMVLQQGLRAPIWGWADEGEEITITFRGQTIKTTARGGKWMVRLDALKAGGPDTLAISGKNSIKINNVLVGEVWLCSGQSNMEWPLYESFESQADIDAATNSHIRLFVTPKVEADEPLERVKSNWQECTPKSAAVFSAVGYYFGRDLQKARGVPVGLIEADMNGSPAQAWVKRAVLEANPFYRLDILNQYKLEAKGYSEEMAIFEKEKAEAARNGTPFNKAPRRAPWKPSELYNGMLSPLIPYGMRGVTWYQGEGNVGTVYLYCTLLPDLIRSWRQDWGQGDFPFLIVQLAPFGGLTDQPYKRSPYSEAREVQLNTVKTVPKTALAVITDVGDPFAIHPRKKQPVGARLALAARGLAYGESIVYSGPLYKSMKVRGDKAVISFDHVGSGLEARGGELKGFAICGEDHVFVWAKAETDAGSGNKKIIVSSPLVPAPVAVRFGWANTPDLNLWNKEGLPASPFRTDDFPSNDAYYKEIEARALAKFGTNGAPKVDATAK